MASGAAAGAVRARERRLRPLYEHIDELRYSQVGTLHGRC